MVITIILITTNYLNFPQNGTTPLMAASTNGHIDIVNVLINNGAGVNDVDNVSKILQFCGDVSFIVCNNYYSTLRWD